MTAKRANPTFFVVSSFMLYSFSASTEASAPAVLSFYQCLSQDLSLCQQREQTQLFCSFAVRFNLVLISHKNNVTNDIAKHKQNPSIINSVADLMETDIYCG